MANNMASVRTIELTKPIRNITPTTAVKWQIAEMGINRLKLYIRPPKHTQ
jgi:hypothetical protein